MFEYLNDIFNQLMEISKHNQILSGVVSLWGLGTVTYLCREVPVKVFQFLKRHFTVELEIRCSDDSFHHFLKWYNNSKYRKNARTLRFSGCKFEDETYLAVGIGFHYFFLKGYPYQIQRYKEEKGSERIIREGITITTIGRRHKPINILLEEITPKTTKNISVYRWEDGDWNFLCEQEPRPFSSLILEEENQTKLLRHLEDFRNNKSWFNSHHIPYRTGICLYGPPGTGKTSLVKAIASMEKKDVYLLSLSSLNDSSMQKAFEGIKKNGLVLIEDIDTFKQTNQREEKDPTKVSFLSLSGILNSIDGFLSSDGRILIITTNQLEKLDSALIRPGRVDLLLNLNYMTTKSAQQAFAKYFPDFKYKRFEVRENLTTAEFQNIVQEHRKDPEAVRQKIARPPITMANIGQALSKSSTTMGR